MKKITLVFMVVLLFSSVVFAQSQNNVTWDMAIVKQARSGEESFSHQQPITGLKSGDEYCIFIRALSPVYCYVVQENSDRTSNILFNGRLESEQVMLIPGDDNFTIPPGTGLIRYRVIVSATPKANLDRQGKLSGAQHDALINEIQVISRSLSQVALAPELPVPMGGGTRGSDTIVYQNKGQETYVKNIVIRH